MSQQLENVVSVELLDNGTLEVIRVVPSHMRYGNGMPVPPHAFKQIYAAKDGKIEMVSHVCGTYIAPQTIPERFEFPEARPET